ncbi:MAG: glutathione-dependent formaldehyde-activating enzyme [Caulobacteraceae bacterium]|nr:glutathione-dependent formaldehyde-activating enzyme [Caulobacteraceae bacterium]
MDQDATPITGGCLCRAVRFEISAAPIVARVCWCRLCQAVGAGGATVNVCFPSDAVRIEGRMNDYACTADSGSSMHRRFCPSCGVHLFSEAESRPHLIFVRAGALDDPEIARPSATIWTSQAPSWACIDADLPQMAAQAPPAA